MVKLPEHRTVRAFMWRARWAIWALFAAVVVRIALPGIVGAATGGELVVVLARDVKASAELIPEDLRLARIPQSALPGGALTSIDSALNHRPRTDLPSGLVLDESLLNSGSSLSDLPSGHVAVALRLTDPGLATKISAGDRIDVMASPGAGAS
ncbi:MAG: SAF domain-containing protein, partial [Bifidobacteriaceae bacterium]|nr:SAF domain-containing protein [Bifidobacteriaceae bacterium]